MNLASIIRNHAEKHGHKPAILYFDQILCYAEVWTGIEAIAALLRSAGVCAGQRVGLSMAENPLHLLAHFAIGRIGAVIVPMDHRWTTAEKKSAAVAFNTVVVLTDGDDIEGVKCRTLNDSSLVFDANDLPPISEVDCDLLISLSSGTTGKPKGALLTHRNFYERFVSQWKAIGYGADDCFAILTPFYFGAGRSFGMSLLTAGGTVRIVPPPMKPPQIIEVLGNDEITAAFVPPTMLRRLFEYHEAGSVPLFSNINYLISSGEPLFADEAAECIRKICPNLFSYYASSEGGGVSVLRAEEFPEFAGTVGKPTYKTEVQIVDADDNDLGDNKVGRLRYRGPGVSTRYLESDGTEHDSGIGGWFYPGDLAERLKSGFIALRGRDKDVIIRGGVNVYPAEIEATLLAHPDITEAAVIGRQDSERGQTVVAFVSPILDVESIVEYCRSNLAPYKVPTQITVLAELPKRSSGKIDKAMLAAD